MKITIIGLPGSGKSTVARKISEKLSIPHIHIDRFWFEAGGRRGSRDTPNIEQVRMYIREKVLKAISAESWVSDGFYSRVQPEIASRADVILFLDVSIWKRLLNHTKRIFQNSIRHTEISLWNDLLFFPEIIRRTFTTGPKLKVFIAAHKDKVVTLRSRAEIDQFLTTVSIKEIP